MGALILKADGSKQAASPANGKDFSLEELRAIVGGYIEVVWLDRPSGTIMVVNEEGKLHGLPLNTKATDLLTKFGIMDYIVGDALVCESEMIK